MPVQQIGLDYSWLINLADIISQARSTGTQAGAGKPTTGKQAGSPGEESAYKGGSFMESGKTQYQIDKEQRREDLLALQERKHEMALKRMDMDQAIAESMSQEKIATIGAEAGTEQAEIMGAAEVGAAQKTSMEKGYELLEMLWAMDKPSRDEMISRLEAKRAENQQAAGGRPVSTITTGGKTIELPGTTPAADPNDPLTQLEEIGAYDSVTGVADPQLTGAAGKPEIDQYMELLDEMLDKNPQAFVAITTGKGWPEVKESMETIGMKAGFSQEVIDKGIGIWKAIVPEYKEPPEETGGLGGFIEKALTPGGVGRTELPAEAMAGAEMYLGGAGAFKEGADIVEKTPGFAANLQDFIETAIFGPWSPAYKKWKDKRTGKLVSPEPAAKKEVGEITDQDVVTSMRDWSKEQIQEAQRVTKEAGLYKGPVDGLHSNALDSAMKKYFSTHKDEFSGKSKKKKKEEETTETLESAEGKEEKK